MPEAKAALPGVAADPLAALEGSQASAASVPSRNK
jgi:hypothetical protein